MTSGDGRNIETNAMGATGALFRIADESTAMVFPVNGAYPVALMQTTPAKTDRCGCREVRGRLLRRHVEYRSENVPDGSACLSVSPLSRDRVLEEFGRSEVEHFDETILC